MNAWLEKLIWMIVPLLFSAVGYMFNTIQSLKDEVQTLNSKMSIVVTKENKVVPSIDAELAREKLRHDVEKYASANRERIVVLEERLRAMETKK